MKNTIKVALFVLSCIPFAAQARGLWIYNTSGQDIMYKTGTRSGVVINQGQPTRLAETPTFLSIKRGSLWTPLETYLVKMHMQKKGMEESKGAYELVGNLYIKPTGIETEVCYRNPATGGKLSMQ